jgi:nucleoside-diphosphate-sugar epimerase
MNLTIVAATGGIGGLLLEEALEVGHTVTVVVRNPKALFKTLRTVRDRCREPNPDSMTRQSAIQGADTVLSGLGARSAADAGVAARGTCAIVQAMRAVGVNRIIVVSAAPIGPVPSPGRSIRPKYDPGDGFFIRHLLAPLTKVALRQHYAIWRGWKTFSARAAQSGRSFDLQDSRTDRSAAVTESHLGRTSGGGCRFPEPTSPTSCVAPLRIPRRSDK